MRTTCDPAWVVDVKVILHDPALSQLAVPAVFFSDGDHDPSRFRGSENDHHRIVLGMLKVGVRASPNNARSAVTPECRLPESVTKSIRTWLEKQPPIKSPDQRDPIK
jgi:hypothetical protein